MNKIVEKALDQLNTLDYNITYHENLKNYLEEIKEFYEFDDDRMEFEEFKISELLEQENIDKNTEFIRVECYHAYSGEEVQVVKNITIDAVLEKVNSELLKKRVE